jgi:hypothetical protein
VDTLAYITYRSICNEAEDDDVKELLQNKIDCSRNSSKWQIEV